MARVITHERPKDTVLVEKEIDEPSGSRAGIAVALIIIGLLIVLMLVGNPFSGGSDTNINVTPRAPTAQ